MNIESLQLIEDWSFIRGNTIAFINSLTNEELVMTFPRPGLNTFLKHFQEVVDVQEAYLDACETGEMIFDKVKDNDGYDNSITKETILEKMKIQDSRIEGILTDCDGKIVVWDENDKKTIHSQIRNLCMHEALHVGQLVAFSYAMGIKIPDTVVEAWALS